MSGALQHDAILAADGPQNVADERGAAALLGIVNRLAFRLSAVALVAAGFVLTFGVVTGHVTKTSVIWQDEVTIFLIAGAIFLSAATVQAGRGHVGIDLLDHWFPASKESRRLAVDAVMLCFCLIFAWKTAMLLHEAYVDGQTSSSTWGPPLSIPYGLMAFGMSLLSVQLLLQVAIGACELGRHDGGRAHGVDAAGARHRQMRPLVDQPVEAVASKRAE